MPLAHDTPHRPAIQLVTGHFRETAGYHVWRTHGTDDWLLIHTLSGRGRFGYRGGEIPAHPGDLVLLRPGTLHDYGIDDSLQRWELLWTHFHARPHWLEWLDWPEVAPGLMRLTPTDASTRRRITARFAELHRLATGALRRREQFAMNALEELLLWCDAINPRSEQARLDERVRQAMDFICRNLSEKIGLDALAEECGLSVSRLAHLFRQHVGLTPQQFLERERLSRAKQLLELTPRTVEAIAEQVGFASPFYFSLRFKRHTGLSPRDYRRRASGEGEAPAEPSLLNPEP